MLLQEMIKQQQQDKTAAAGREDYHSAVKVSGCRM